MPSLNTGNAILSNAITVDGSYNVGIGGAVDASYKLKVTGASLLTGDLTLNNGNADGAQLVLTSSGYSNWNLDNYSGRFRAYYGSTEYFTILASGNVGIGATAPLSKLSIGGNGYADRAITAIASGTDFGMTLQQNSTGGGLQIYANVSSWGNIPLQVQTNSGYQFIINTAGNVGIGTGSPSAKLNLIGGEMRWGYTSDLGALSYTDNKPMLASVGATDFLFYTNAAERMRITSAGRFYLNNTSITQDFVLQSANNGFTRFATRYTSAGTNDTPNYTGWMNYDYSSQYRGGLYFSDQSFNTSGIGLNLELMNTSGTVVNALLFRYDQYLRIPSVYSFTTGSGANVYVNPDGGLYRSTSSLKYKTDVKDYSRGLAEVMQMRPVFYKGKGESDGDKQFAGLIAEEIHDLGLTEFVQYTEDGTPDALAYQNMVALLVKAIQELNQTIQNQQQQINQLINK